MCLWGERGLCLEQLFSKCDLLNIEVHEAFSIMVSSGYMPSSGIDGSYVVLVLFFFLFFFKESPCCCC